jgi:hypothetical protein
MSKPVNEADWSDVSEELGLTVKVREALAVDWVLEEAKRLLRRAKASVRAASQN